MVFIYNKPKRRKANECFRHIATICPSCLSTLIINKDGRYVCSGDKLTIWKDQFKVFENMNEYEQETYLETLENKEKFLELFGKREQLECDYSANIVDLLPQKSIEIPDPLAVSRRERKLKRELTEQELNAVPRIKFPEEV